MWASAPARLDVMGGIADYSGSLVLEYPLARRAHVMVASRKDRLVRIGTTASDLAGIPLAIHRLADLGAKSSGDYASICNYFNEHPQTKWSSLLAGAISVLGAEKKLHLENGLDIFVHTDIPLGAGVSSSAAVEVAVLRALGQMAGLEASPEETARLGQCIENHIAGAPCGIMDQMTSAAGREGQLLKLRCDPCTVEGFVETPPGAVFLGVDSGVKHSVGGLPYRRTRTGTFMAKAILLARGLLSPGDTLCSLDPIVFRQISSLLPKAMTGSEFLAMGLEYPDSATHPEPDIAYYPRAAAEHAVLENRRVQEFASLIENPRSEASLKQAGRLMHASHWSYSQRAYLGSHETDLIVKRLRSKGLDIGVLGAKITGGGCGGTVAVMGLGDPEELARLVEKEISDIPGIRPQIIQGSSPGAYDTEVKTIVF